MKSFPKIEGLAEDEQWQALLDICRAPGWNRLYLVGCFARYVTAYSQQVRALNLVDALCKSLELSKHDRVAVVGAGIAGITAAAWLRDRGVKVTLFEKESTLWLQHDCSTRLVHPHIYNWPFTLGLGSRTDLPLMNWSASFADRVAAGLQAEWEKLCGEVPVHQLAIREDSLKANADGSIDIKADNCRQETFAAVLLTVGFGLERKTKPASVTPSYWKMDDLAKVRGRCLISGYGDGAVTDLMRLCILRFSHGETLGCFKADQIDQEALKILAAKDGRSEDLSGEFCEWARKLKPEGLKLRGKETEVLMNCTPQQLFSDRSSVLNRLIVAYLWEQDCFDYLKPPGRISRVVRLKGELKRVFFEKPRPPADFNEVIVRHGALSVIEQSFPRIWEASRGLRELWDRLPQNADWTARPMYMGKNREVGAGSPPLRVDFAGKAGCFLLHQGKARRPQLLIQLASLALKQAKSGIAHNLGREVDPEIQEASIADSVADPAQFMRTVRALCESDIAIVDVTDYNCVAMLFLGIRAASRRGVTITVRHDAGRESRFERQPFNLFEVNPVGLVGKDQEVIDNLAEALSNGCEQKQLLPGFYLDLPVYDAVRRLGPKIKAYASIPGEKECLLLCWFEKEYAQRGGNQIETLLKSKYEDTEVLRIVDTSSPQLVGQRLYEKIRRCRVCVADWTGWRPNVFFELGVRLAINPVEPLMVLDEDEWPLKKFERNSPPLAGYANRRKWGQELAKLLVPTPYGRSSSTPNPMHSPLGRAIEGQAEGRGSISQGAVYRAVRSAMRDSDEPWGQPVEEELTTAADGLIGGDAFEQANPNLYAHEDAIRGKVRRAAHDRLLAAWLYLDYRHGLGRKGFPATDLSSRTARSIRHVGRRLYSFYESSSSKAGKRLAADILQALSRLGLATQADPIDAALELKARANKYRKARRYKDSIACLTEARDKLEPELTHENPRRALSWERDVAAELANIYGSLGGTYRSAGNLDRAIQAYDKGFEYESDKRYEVVSTYNLLQRLVARVLKLKRWSPAERPRVESVNLFDELAAAEKTVIAQLRIERSGDEWAMVDHALIRLLLGREDNANDWEHLRQSLTSDYVKQSVSKTLREIMRAFKPHAAGPADEPAHQLFKRLETANDEINRKQPILKRKRPVS